MQYAIDLKIDPAKRNPTQSNATNKMSFIRRLMLANIPATKLGRWQLNYDPQIVNSKVDQANEDHCGCCHAPTHQYQTIKKEQLLHQEKQNQKRLQKYSESEEYYIPYVM